MDKSQNTYFYTTPTNTPSDPKVLEIGFTDRTRMLGKDIFKHNLKITPNLLVLLSLRGLSHVSFKCLL